METHHPFCCVLLFLYNQLNFKKQTMNLKTILLGVACVVTLITLIALNPFAVNDAGARTVVQQVGGKQFVQFEPGLYYAGFWAKTTEWPNQISVTYSKAEPDLDLEDNGIEVGSISIMFSDGTKADAKGIVQFVLPSDENSMRLLHNTHRTPQSLVTKRLATFTKECLQSSAQLMTSDKHYGGARTQMSQDFLDQLKNGVYLAQTEEKVVYDSIEQERKRYYITEIQKDKTGQPRRKASAIAEYSISVADAAINDVDYEDKVDQKLSKIIDASTKSAISRQELVTAQQQALTARAEGEKNLVEIEYKQKQDQTVQVVQAQTKVEVAKQDKLQQQIAYEASILEAKKIKELADAEAYQKAKVMQADGALEKKLAAQVEIQKAWADAFSKYTGAIVPQTQLGGNGGGNGVMSLMDLMTIQTAKTLNSAK
jgi:hypothetical protein